MEDHFRTEIYTVIQLNHFVSRAFFYKFSKFTQFWNSLPTILQPCVSLALGIIPWQNTWTGEGSLYY
jgi:hypothetical protein